MDAAALRGEDVAAAYKEGSDPEKVLQRNAAVKAPRAAAAPAAAAAVAAVEGAGGAAGLAPAASVEVDEGGKARAKELFQASCVVAPGEPFLLGLAAAFSAEDDGAAPVAPDNS